MADKVVWEMQVFSAISSIVAFGFGVALGASLAAPHPFAAEHADFGHFYVECAEIENDL